MSTTTIRLPDALKARIAKAAEAAGTTSHNFGHLEQHEAEHSQ
ncbi:hypothetical protein [Xanthomonas sp. CFBP 8445]|nr:hypothetical protein [Xanthomonas sp. CFBP 8445]UYC14309.1 hypothetical protein NUG21_16935 [Xanthomonas sp. CFBP 8445]